MKKVVITCSNVNIVVYPVFFFSFVVFVFSIFLGFGQVILFDFLLKVD